MGPLLTWGRCGAALAALSLTGCFPLLSFQKPACVPTRQTVPLAAPYNQYFGSLPVYNPSAGTFASVAARSSTGLTDSYGGGNLVTQEVYDEAASSPCEIVLHEQRSVVDYASLYGYSFATYVEQLADGPRLLLRDLSSVSATFGTELTYRFAGSQAQLTYRDANNTTQTYAPAPTVTELRSFVSGTRTYAQVWRLTNPLHAAQGRATAVVAYYVDRDYGLIRFDQRDGTSWTLAR